ncbi:hypothetical protein HDU84_004250 [Entophlyctis sp. JEL0112]|nr:hypothetical protein HDU84_004250 [Entophlyctis sp. JEL0112]
MSYPQWIANAQAEIDSKTKPPGSLGRLEDWAVRVAALRRSLKPRFASPLIPSLTGGRTLMSCRVRLGRLILFAADHGLADDNVSNYPKVVTREMLRNLSSGGAAINAMCNATPNLSICVVDVGVDTSETFPNVHVRKTFAPHGTLSSLTGERAMTEEQFESAFAAGMDFANSALSEEVDALALGELGIGNTAVASILLAAVSGRPADQVTGKGTGVDGDKLKHKVDVVNSVLVKHQAVISSKNWKSIFCAVGGLEIAAICGAAIATARCSKKPALLVDGFITTVAFLMAVKLFPEDAEQLYECVFFAHNSAEHAAKIAIDEVKAAFGPELTAIGPSISPMLDLGLRLGEGTGAALGFSLLKAAAHIMSDMNTFAGAGVSENEK